MKLLFFILVCFGATQIITSGSIFAAIRKKIKPLECSMCVGFWVGIVIFVLFELSHIKLFLHYRDIDYVIWAFMLGCLSSGTSYVLCQLFGDDGVKISKS